MVLICMCVHTCMNGNRCVQAPAIPNPNHVGCGCAAAGSCMVGSLQVVGMRQICHVALSASIGLNIWQDDVSITHLTYGKEFSKAIEEKQVAEQEALPNFMHHSS